MWAMKVSHMYDWVNRKEVVFSQFDIKLGGNCFQHIKASFPSVNKEKVKAEVVDGPHIEKLIKDHDFFLSMNDVNIVINF